MSAKADRLREVAARYVAPRAAEMVDIERETKCLPHEAAQAALQWAFIEGYYAALEVVRAQRQPRGEPTEGPPPKLQDPPS